MDLELNASAEEINRLQHCINDLVSLLGLPAVWSGSEPSRILEILLDALLPMLCLDFISGRVKYAVTHTPIGVIRVARSCKLKPHEIREMLNAWFEADGQKSLPATRKRFGDKGIAIFPVPLNVHGGAGMILAGSSREDFPAQTESVILSAAANQASNGLKEVWLLTAQKRNANQLEKQVAERTEGLAKQAEETQGATARNLVAIINTIPTTAWTTRPDGYCDFLNQVWLDYAGMTAEQAQGWGWAEAIHPDDREQLVEDWQASLASGIPVDTEARIRRFDSSYRWFLIRANPLRDESGNILKWYGTCTEIEDRKRWEQILRARELSWRQIVDNIPGLVATTGAMGEVEFLNRQTLEFFGKTNEELKDWALIGAVHPDDLPRVIEVRKQSIETGQIYEVEHRCRRADGVYRWFQVRGLPVRDAENKVTAWYLLLTDIDDRKRAEEALRASELDARLSLDNMPAFFVRLSSDGVVEFVNRSFMQYFGKTLEEIKNWSTNDMIHPDDLAHVIEVFGNSLSTGQPFDREYRLRRFDGVYRWFQTRANPVRSVDGRILHWNALARDIDDRKKAEEALNKTRTEFAHVARITTLNALTASIAHEINQPLASLITNASTSLRRLNADPPNVDGARETVMRTIRDGNRASDVITRLRTLYTSKVFTLEPLDLNAATHEVIALSLSDLQANRVILKSELADDLPLVNGDRVQLQQVILNLVRNASDAMVSVHDRPRELHIRTEWDGAEWVRLSVKDVGLGFTPEAADKLFQAFYTTKTDGMGIGLHVSQSIIEGHHGRLWATANDGPGATFSFAIPCRPEPLDHIGSHSDRTDTT